jgi:hypothetical protein
LSHAVNNGWNGATQASHTPDVSRWNIAIESNRTSGVQRSGTGIGISNSQRSTRRTQYSGGSSSARNRIYQVHNEYKPPHETPEREIAVTKDFKFKAPAHTHRWHDIYVSFYAVNIGSTRAENVTFSVTNDFKRRGGREFGDIFKLRCDRWHPVNRPICFA